MGKSEKKRHSDKKRSDKDSKRRKRDDLAGADEAKIDLGLPDDEESFGACTDVTLFEKIGRVGEGTYGVVYKARNSETGEIVALKRMRAYHDKDGFAVTSLREIKLLEQLRHPNIVSLLEVAVTKKLDSIFLVFEFCNCDMAALLDKMRHSFTEAEIKCLLIQLLSAVDYLHQNSVVHRDIKLSNLLYTNAGEVKLADFGLARIFDEDKKMTPTVVTLWYRAPELLLGSKHYDSAIDLWFEGAVKAVYLQWAVGCIFGEFLLRKPLLPSNSPIEQLDKIFQLLGTPNPSIWPGLDRLPLWANTTFKIHKYNDLRNKFPFLSDRGFDLLNSFLTYDPTKRITAAEALQHPYLTMEKPLPKPKHLMPSFQDTFHNSKVSPKRRLNFD